MTLSNDAEYVLRTVEERGIRFIRLWFTDVLGFLKSISITAQELETVLEEGEGFDGSAIEGFARIQEADMVAKPDPSTFQIVPWRSSSTGPVLLLGSPSLVVYGIERPSRNWLRPCFVATHKLPSRSS